MSDEGRLVAGRYRIVRRIGSGAMGVVWQAQDEVLHRTVAIKQLLLQPGLDASEAEDARQRTMREGRIAARLHHPNAITVFDVVADEYGRPCLVMEYLPSTSLAAVLQEHKTLPPVEVARIGAQLAAALREAHAVGIVHRDIKPANILLNSAGTVKITDFGISRATDDVTVTKTGMIAGTPAYLAPEVAIGGNPGPASDIFSLGSTLYAACEGVPPFGSPENTLQLLHAVAAGQINPPRRSGPLTSVLAVLLHPDVHRRPDATETEELLAAVARGETPLGAEETVVTPNAGRIGTVVAAQGMPPHGPHGHAPTEHYQQAGFPTEDYDQAYSSRDHADRYVSEDSLRERSGTAGTAAVAKKSDYLEPESTNPERGEWKKPALIGVFVVAALALGIWFLSSGNQQQPSTNQSPASNAPLNLSPGAKTSAPNESESSEDTPSSTNSSSSTSQTKSSNDDEDEPAPGGGGGPKPTTSATPSQTLEPEPEPTTTTNSTESSGGSAAGAG